MNHFAAVPETCPNSLALRCAHKQYEEQQEKDFTNDLQDAVRKDGKKPTSIPSWERNESAFLMIFAF